MTEGGRDEGRRDSERRRDPDGRETARAVLLTLEAHEALDLAWAIVDSSLSMSATEGTWKAPA